MPHIEKPNFKAKRKIPLTIQFLLILSVILGLWAKSCWRGNAQTNIEFQNIRIENQTFVSADVIFEVENHTRQAGRRNIFIELHTSMNEPIATLLTTIEIAPKQTTKHVKVVTKFDRPPKPDEQITNAKIRLYP